MRKDNKEHKAIRITFTLDKRTLDSIDKIAFDTFGSKSSAIRLAVSEYAKQREQHK